MEINLANSHKLIRHIKHVYNIFESDRGLNNVDVFLSALHLKSAIDNALIDMERMTSFHFLDGENMPDNHKYAGFVSKWIAKIRPIQFASDKPLNLTNYNRLSLNADFSVYVMSSFLRYEFYGDLARYLRYWFNFRDERGETLALFAYACEEIIKNKNE